MECLVIGSGIIGSSIAWRLAQRGARVTVLEAERYFGASSWAGAGMLSPHGERFPDAAWQERGVASLGQYPAFVDELRRDSGDAIDFCVCGAVEIRGEEERVYPEEGIVNPRDLGFALRTVLRDLDVRILQYRPAAGIRRSGSRWAVDALESVIEADTVVVAAGAWSGGLTVDGGPLPATVPVKGYLLGYSCQPGSLKTVRRSGHTYILQRADGFTIAGSTEEQIGFDANVDPLIVRELQGRAAQLWDGVAGRAPDRVWTGLRPATESGQIHVEPWAYDASLWLAYGHYRNGILLAPWTADHVATALVPAASVVVQ